MTRVNWPHVAALLIFAASATLVVYTLCALLGLFI